MTAPDQAVELLLPAPQRVQPAGAVLRLPGHVRIRLPRLPQRALPAARCLARSLQRAGCATEITALPSSPRAALEVTLALSAAASARGEAYALSVGRDSIVVEAFAEPGLMHGVHTLGQLVAACTGPPGEPVTLPCVEIQDWPDVPHRGVMLDVSRDRVPTMETLAGLVELLASWKVNQLQLYMEHTFAYDGHRAVWRDASPLTGEQILELDRLCRSWHLELVPNQNSLGHMHRWLIHEPYRALAECPQGIEHPFSPEREPYGLCPIDPGSIELLAGLYDQLLPHFTSRQFNVGLDEAFDLGRGRSADACERLGKHRVYLDFVHKVHRLVTARGRVMQMWGDIVVAAPEPLLAELPRDAVALEWGYEAEHPFAEHAGRFAAAGLPLYLCPGTSSWNSIAGRAHNALHNVAAAATSAAAAGALGLLVTDWGDNGHIQPLSASYLGLAAAASMAWNARIARAPERPDWSRLLDLHAFGAPDGGPGRAALELGNVYRALGVRAFNGTLLFRLLLRPGGFRPQQLPDGVTPGGFERAREAARAATAELGRSTGDDLAHRELQWAGELLQLACEIGRRWAGPGLLQPVTRVPAAARAPLGERLEQAIAGHRELWARRSRPGGLERSVARLTPMLAALRGP